ncbi:hypothetical protein BC834DRAFT_982486 [Gloeopeniophorella convolvens]|nr:hypothetical protein BC834DRAFT_982486 [Gloeopeniophorella convolvens]
MPRRRRKITPGPLVASGRHYVSTDGVESQTRQKTMAGHVPDVALLRVFDFVRLATPSPTKTGWIWPWQPLAQVCHRWRQLILSSPERLRLDFRITHGAPVPSILRIPFISALDIEYWNPEYKEISYDGEGSEDSFYYDEDDVDESRLVS